MKIYETVVHRYGMKERNAYFMKKSDAIRTMNEVIDVIINERKDLKITKRNKTSATIEFEDIPNIMQARSFDERVYAQVFVTQQYVNE